MPFDMAVTEKVIGASIVTHTTRIIANKTMCIGAPIIACTIEEISAISVTVCEQDGLRHLIDGSQRWSLKGRSRRTIEVTVHEVETVACPCIYVVTGRL